jgi:hypothetical protein
VVIAACAEDAVKIHPNTYADYIWCAKHDSWIYKDSVLTSRESSWVRPDKVLVEKIGIALAGECGDVVCASFNAG